MDLPQLTPKEEFMLLTGHDDVLAMPDPKNPLRLLFEYIGPRGFGRSVTFDSKLKITRLAALLRCGYAVFLLDPMTDLLDLYFCTGQLRDDWLNEAPNDYFDKALAAVNRGKNAS